jgi:hypothetical protein
MEVRAATMSNWWLKILGVDTSEVPPDATTEFGFALAPQSWTVFLVLALAAALIWGVFWLYRREIATCPPRIRAVLAVLRAAVLVVLILVFMGPSLSVTHHRTIQPHVVLLLDDSMSMSIRDAYADEAMRSRIARSIGRDARAMATAPPTRDELVDSLVARHDGQWLLDLATKGRLRVLTFSNSVKLREARGATTRDASDAQGPITRAEPVPPLNPTGPGTNLAKAMREGLRLMSGNPAAGMIVVTDGQNTEGDDPLIAADAAAQQGVPVLAVGVGDPAEPRNLRVSEMWSPDSVFRSDPFVIQARIEGSAMEDGPIAIELLQRNAEASTDTAIDRPVATKTVRLIGGKATVPFEYTPPEAGQFIFTVRAPVQAGEQITSDNAKSMPVKVLSEQAKVLLIAGGPTWEYQMVRTLLTRDKTINVSCWLQSLDDGMRQDGDTVITKLPTTLKEWLEYDVVVMLDPNPVEFDEDRVRMIEQFVGEHGGGLMWQAGSKYTQRFFSMPSTRGIRDFLPMKLSTEAAKTEPLDLTQTREWPMRLTASGVDHALLRLHSDPQISRTMFQSLPGLYWSYPAADAKPGQLTLLEHTDPRLNTQGRARPLLVAGQHGPGRTLYLGFDGTWRWRKLGEKFYDQFWVQAVRYLVEGRLLGGQHRGRIGTDRDTYGRGDPIAISARLLGQDFKPMLQPTVPASIKTPAGSTAIELKQVAGRPGHYEAIIVAAELGAMEISVTLAGEGSSKPSRLSKQVTVELPRVEFADPRLNRTLLTEIASRSGGQYFDFADADRVAASLADKRERTAVPGKPIELWDTNRLLLLIVLLLTAEWALRKYYKLL